MLSNLRHKTYNLLRKSEKYTQTDMVYLAKGGFWLALAQIIISTSSFLLAIAFANLLPKDIYGNYRYILSLIGILDIFTMSGINTALIGATARQSEGEFWPSFIAKIKWSILATIGSIGVAIYYYINQNFILASAFGISAILLPFFRLSGMYIALLQGRKNFKLSTIYESSARVVAVMAMILVIWLTDNIFLMILAYFLPETILHFIFTLATIKKQPLNKIRDNQTVSFGLHLSVMELIRNIAAQLDKILIFHSLGAINLAVYSFATAPASQIKSVLMNIKILALPKISEQSDQNIRLHLAKKIKKLELLTLLIIIIFIPLAPLFYKLFFPQYLDSVRYAQVYILILLAVPRTLLSTAMVAKMKQAELYGIRIISPVLRIIILLFAFKLWSLWGIVAGAVVSELAILILYQIFYNRAFSLGGYTGPDGDGQSK